MPRKHCERCCRGRRICTNQAVTDTVTVSAASLQCPGCGLLCRLWGKRAGRWLVSCIPGVPYPAATTREENNHEDRNQDPHDPRVPRTRGIRVHGERGVRGRD